MSVIPSPTTVQLQWTYQQGNGPQVTRFGIRAVYEGPCVDVNVPSSTLNVSGSDMTGVVVGLEEFSLYNATVSAVTSGGVVARASTTVTTLPTGSQL